MPSDATYIEELWVGIKADLSHMRAGLKMAEKDARTFVGRVGASSDSLKKFGKTVTTTSAIILGLGGIATAVFANFEQSMANTQSVLGATQDEFQELSDYAREMGKTTVFTASQAADAMYYLASAGYNTQQVMSSLNGTLDLAAATQYDLAETTRIVVSTLNAFTLGAEEASRVANVFAAIISGSQATMDRLGDSMKYVAPIANALNISLEQTTAALGVLYNSGLAASQAGTYLRQGLIRLQKPTAQAMKAIEALGLTYEDINPQVKNLVDIIRTLEDAEAGAIDKGDELAAIFGARALTAFQILVKRGADEISNLEEKITGTSKSAEMAETQIDTLKGSFKLLLSAIQEAAIQIGEILAPAIRTVTDVIRDFVQIFNELPAVFKSIMVVVPTVAAAFGLLVGPIALLLGMLPNIVAGIGMMNAAVGGMLGPIGILALVIGGVVTAIGYWVSAERRQAAEMKKNIKYIGETVDKRIEELDNTTELISKYEDLAKKSNRSASEQRALNSIIDDLNSKYPNLNLETEDYAGNLDKVKKASEGAATELSNLLEIKKTLEKIKVTIEIADIQNTISELKEDIMTESSSIEKLLTFDFAPVDDKSIVRVLDTYKEISGLATQLDVRHNRIGVSMTEMEDVLKRVATQEDGINRIRKDTATITDAWVKNETEIASIKSKALEEQRELTVDEAVRVSFLKTESQQYKDISTLYTEILSKSSSLTESELKLQRALEKRKVLSEETVVKTTVVDDDSGGKPKTIEDTELEQERQQLIFELHKQTLQSKLQASKAYSDESLANSISYLEQEYEYKKAIMEREKELALQKANEIGVSEEEVIKSFSNRAVELEREKQQAIQDVKDEYSETEEAKELAKLEFQYEQDEIDMETYKTALEEKLDLLEEWSAEYISIMKKITSLENKEYQKRLKSAQSWGYGIARVAETVGEAFEKQMSTGMTSAWKVILKAVVDMIAEHYKSLLRMAIAADIGMQNYTAAAYKSAQISLISGIQSYAKARVDSAAIGAEVLKSGTLNVHAGETIVPASVTRKTKSEYENRMQSSLYNENNNSAIVNNIVGDKISESSPSSSILNVLTDISKLFVKSMEYSNSAVGSEITKSGILNVHAGEQVVPASIVRKTKEVYQESAYESNKFVGDVKVQGGSMDDAEAPPPIIINYPMMDDEEFWDQVIEDKFLPAWNRYNKRF